MLETVKQCIQSAPDISFQEFFQMYVLSVQDSNIDREFSYLVNRNVLGVNSMGVLIKNTIEGLKCI